MRLDSSSIDKELDTPSSCVVLGASVDSVRCLNTFHIYAGFGGPL